MNLLLVTTSYPDENEGASAAGTFVADFVRALVESNHQVTVTAPAKTQSTRSEDGIQVRRFAVPMLPLSLLNPTNPIHWLPILKTLRNGQQSVNQACMDEAFDHILALWALPSGFWARHAWNTYGVPYSTWALGSDIWSLGKIPGISHILRQVLRDAQARFADGHELCNAVEKIGNARCRFLPSTREFPLNLYHEPAKQAPYCLAFLGRWHKNKGIDLLLESLSMLSEHDWSRIYEIKIHGGGPLEKTVLQRTSQLQKAGKPVTVGGYLDRAAAAELIGWADYLLIPSRIESIPVIFSDAMKSNTPIVATPVGDLHALVQDYRCGITATAATPHSLVAAIGEALDSSAQSFVSGIEKARADFDLRTIAMHFLDDIRTDKSIHA